jgi:cell division protein FtsB
MADEGADMSISSSVALQRVVKEQEAEIAALRAEVEQLKEENRRVERVAVKYYKALRGEGE